MYALVAGHVMVAIAVFLRSMVLFLLMDSRSSNLKNLYLGMCNSCGQRVSEVVLR